MGPGSLERRAMYQALGLVLLALVAGAALLWVARQPADADALKAKVAIVRSQAAATRLLQQELGHVPSRFVRAHAEQLGRNVDRMHDELASKRVEPPLARAKADAIEAAARLARVLDALSGTTSGSIAEDAQPLVAMLKRLEEVLRR